MDEKSLETKMKVCVIGAGAAGLCAARYLANEPDVFEFVVFEKTDTVGGTWVYTDRVGLDEYGLPIHSSMYKNLRTNTAKEIMKFPNYKDMKGGKGSCVSHEVVLDYLKCFADDFKLKQFIQFYTAVESVKLDSQLLPSKWRVGVRNVKTGEKRESSFDAVMICTGQFSEPYIPNIPGLSNFSGTVLHSHDYRKPEDFAGQIVILLGASSSGTDISLALAGTAARVYLSHNKEKNCIFNNSVPEISEVPEIVGFENGYFLLKDDSTVWADVLIFCTGYNYSYPFLDKSCGITVEEKYIAPLYKHVINIEHPTMSFIGIIRMFFMPFTLFALQVQYFLSTLKDERRLPSKFEMLENDKFRSTNKKLAHVSTNMQEYLDDLAQAVGLQPLPPFYMKACETWITLRISNITMFRNYNLIVSKDGEDVRVVESLHH